MPLCLRETSIESSSRLGAASTRQFGRMLVSQARGRWAAIDAGKVSAGAFLTTGDSWLLPQVRRFLRAARPRRILDPFAGEGHLLDAVAGLAPVAGHDLHHPRWPRRDSLVRVAAAPGTLILTNPPWLAKHSAARKRVRQDLERYYQGGRDDLYQVALDRCLAAAGHVVAILPETFLTSGYPTGRLESLTVLERSPFSDTTQPACVACFGPVEGDPGRAVIFRDRERLGRWRDVTRIRAGLEPAGTAAIRFNAPRGLLGLRAVDNLRSRIAFLPAADLAYDSRRILVSSRLVTRIAVDGVPARRIGALARAANRRLASLRHGLGDLALSAFKGNDAAGRRRRRLDYRAARAILENALADLGL